MYNKNNEREYVQNENSSTLGLKKNVVQIALLKYKNNTGVPKLYNLQPHPFRYLNKINETLNKMIALRRNQTKNVALEHAVLRCELLKIVVVLPMNFSSMIKKLAISGIRFRTVTASPISH